MTQTTITAADQTRISDLIHQLMLDSTNRRIHYNTWQETSNEGNREMFHLYCERIRKINAELLVEYGINIEAAEARKIDSILNEAA